MCFVGDPHTPGHVCAALRVWAPCRAQSAPGTGSGAARHIRAARSAEQGCIPLGLLLMLRAPALPARFRESDGEFWVT